jgi:hypothetical protein
LIEWFWLAQHFSSSASSFLYCRLFFNSVLALHGFSDFLSWGVSAWSRSRLIDHFYFPLLVAVAAPPKTEKASRAA